MKQIVTRLAALINVKTIVTLIITVVFAILAVRGTIDAGQTVTITSMVLSFYFGVQHEKKNTEEK